MSGDVEYDPEGHSPPAEFNVLRTALQEIDYVVGNEGHLDELDCAYLRSILFAALNDGFTTHGTRILEHPDAAVQWHQRRQRERGDLP